MPLMTLKLVCMWYEESTPVVLWILYANDLKSTHESNVKVLNILIVNMYL